MKKQKIICSEQNEGESYNVQIGSHYNSYTAINVLYTGLISTFFAVVCSKIRGRSSRLMTKVNETSYAARVSLLDAAISLVRRNYCLLSIYTLHNAAPRLAIAGHLSGPGPGSRF